tara:strand:+ start:370 stop:1212 length:843 start_codon:yes stop_codon:yes gene_type:complete
MDYEKYVRAKAGVASTVAFVQKHSRSDMHVLGKDELGQTPFDSDHELSNYTLSNRLELLPADFDLEPLTKPLLNYWSDVQSYRIRQRRKDDWLENSFLGRWENKLNTEARRLGKWREKITVTLQFGESQLSTASDNEIEWDGVVPFSHSATSWGQHNLHIAIGGNYFTKVKPLFEDEPLVEKVSTRGDGSHAYQYLVAKVDETVTEIQGVPMEHGIRAIKFHGFETYGRSNDRKIEPVTRWLALAAKTIGDDTIVGTATSAKKAYALVKSRIARDMMAKL